MPTLIHSTARATAVGSRPHATAHVGDLAQAIPFASVAPLLELVDSLGDEDDRHRIAARWEQAIRLLVDADAGACVFVDPPNPADAEARASCAGPGRGGLVDSIARTGRGVRLERAGDDPRCDGDADLDGGSPRERFLAVAGVAEGATPSRPAPSPSAVLVARRAPEEPPFDALDEATLALLAGQLAAALSRAALRRRLDSRLEHGAGAADDLFRDEALAARRSETDPAGRPLELTPGWLRRVFLLLVAAFVAAAAFLGWGSLDHHVAGVAVIRAEPPATGRPPAIVAFLPGRHRPLLEPGMPMRLELDGYRGAWIDATVDQVGAAIVGPDQARRELRAGVAETLPLTGPQVVVLARPSSPTFVFAGRRHSLDDGLTGRAEVRVGSERLAFTLLPGLRAVTGGPDA